ncbi:MAG: PIG-L family deacetylase [Lewinellaceae bacterium]|nr:PIG-L family deacetylase [Phaeodactylibacter sp.]MCB9350654.1 PIG-L family deacetylase [Lewinellaceae bacterium]
MINWRHLLLLGLVISTSFQLPAQAPRKWTSAETYKAIQKLNFLGSALYVAAHPDDENQRLISYLSNDVNAITTYLAMTRGDGGQNEIGPEIEELLGVIRTQELLAARRIDGGNQMFSRANDFGYSKNPEETLEIWGHDEALSDVVWAIRKWRPDIIINRFDHESAGRTHGHHTTSAMLSYEAFELATDKNAFPEQLEYVDTWQPKRLFFNTSWWFYGSQENFEKADKSKMLSLDVGVYYPVLGKSNTEIAAAARSMHKAQGFGDAGTRGSQMEYLQLLKGEMPADKENLFAGINTTWSRIEGGAPIGKILSEVEASFQFTNPGASVPQLMEALTLIEALPDGFWKKMKQQEIKEVIQACLGLYLEAAAGESSATSGEAVELNIEAINRSRIPVRLQSVSILPAGLDTTLSLALDYNEGQKLFKTVTLPLDMEMTSPYWLKDPWEEGRYTVADQRLRGLPETPKAFRVQFDLMVAGRPFTLQKEVVYKYEDPVKGEVFQPFEITPPVFVETAEPVYVFGHDEPQTVEVVVKSGKANVSGTLELCHSAGWSVKPASIDFELNLKGEEKTLRFQLSPPRQQDENFIVPLAKVEGQGYSRKLTRIDYNHIPVQTILRDASAKVARVELEKAGNDIGYIMGLGDEIPASLEQIGYHVSLLKEGDITLENLQRFDAVILGVRAYNGLERARFFQPALFEYVKKGGTLIVQYNKNFGLTLPMEDLAPYPLKISRDRVTVENAPVRFLKPEHPILNWPNKITESDFDGWIQERGLYFPNEWAEQFEPILSSNDPGEPPRDGGLLVARYGEGYYIYTGYSWFRELPAGVPGAFRLFANMISIGKKPRP